MSAFSGRSLASLGAHDGAHDIDDAVSHNVVEPLAERGIVVPDEDVADLRSAVVVA